MMIEHILRSHIVRCPAMQIQDLYKLIHQAALGSEHAIVNSESARRWMERELAEMGAGPQEAMIDPISADGQIVRVHLRPFVEQGGDVGMLLNAFIRTANEFHGSREALIGYWNKARELQHFPLTDMDAFFEPLQTRGFPAVHHSPEYERLYRPAYRVVWRTFIV